MKQKRIDPAFLAILIMILVALVFGVIISNQIRRDRVSQFADNNSTLPILIVVTQEGQIVFSQILLFDVAFNRYALYDVPYNLGMILTDLGRVDRLSVLYEERDIQVFQDRVSSVFDIAIPFRLVFSIEQYSAFIDFLGGVEIFLVDAIDMQDEDTFVRIPNGEVILDGAKVASLLRYHGVDESGTDRLGRLFSLTQGLITRIGAEQALFESSYARTLLEGMIDSNLEYQGLISLFTHLGQEDAELVITQRVLGTERIVQTQEGAIPLLFPHFEGQILRDSVRRTLGSLKVATDDHVTLGAIRVEVLNGTLSTGLARRTGDLLSNYGVHVIGVGNAEAQDVEHTQIIYHTSQQAGQKIAGLIRGQRIIPGSGINLEGADVTIILGRDFDGWYVR